MNSTFPGINFLKIPKGKSRELVEGSCNPKVGGKTKGVKAKFKYSAHGTKTASILGYYHVSRALGIKMIPPAVLRTLDKSFHEKVADKGVEFSSGDPEYISKGWRQVHGLIASRDSDIVIPDGSHTYGALSENPTNEQKTYRGVWLGGASKKQRLINFMTRESGTYQALKDRGPVSGLVGADFNSDNYSAIQRMKNVSDMIILDTIFGQRDRFGNTHSVYHWMVIAADGEVKKFSIDDVEDMIAKDAEQGLPGMATVLKDFKKAKKMPKDWRKEIRPRRAKIRGVVKEYFAKKAIRSAFAEILLLKDSDAGLTSYNPFAAHRVIEWVYHVSPETFEQLMKLYQKVIVEASMDDFLSNNLTMDADELKRFKAGLKYVAEDLITKDEAGELFKDLKVKAHFNL